MKFLTIVSQALLIISSFACADISKKNPVANVSGKIADKGFAVVELFTSEGCSSCPPADKAVAKLLEKYASNVYVLSYHVDYWDGLGWKDIFSNAAYTQTQREYAKSFKLSSVYTPQVVVNGTGQFVGSNESKLNAAVNKDLQEAATSKLTIEAISANNKTVTVNYTTDAVHSKLKIALVQLMADNKIKRGENSGATLHHVNIVRDLKTVTATASGSVVLNMPENLNAADCKIIAFAQNTTDNSITAATKTGIK